MNVGTKSVLFGAHCFFLHPLFVALGWWKLYGFPWDPRLWVAFFVHDLGYWGKPNMDGPEGERHPEWGARVMSFCFDLLPRGPWVELPSDMNAFVGPWGQLVLFHSRFLAKSLSAEPSRLCFADKLAICLTPAWLYLPMAKATGEIREYRSAAADRSEGSHEDPGLTDRAWFNGMQAYMMRWIAMHKDGRTDTWTPDGREAKDESGVWK